MKGTRAISFLLVFALMASLVVPGFFAQPARAEGEGTDNGMRISKTATKNDDDGSYTITLEAYATGSKVISQVKKDIPTDIVLVLDQSGSMDNAMNTYSFRPYTNRTNSQYYNIRHNGGNNPNLYYQMKDGGYATVSVTRTEIVNDNNTTECSETWTNADYYSQRDRLYVKVGEEYKKVTLTWDGKWSWESFEYVYTYSYTFPDGTVISEGSSTSPGTFEGKGPLYYVNSSSVEYRYSYTYTDENRVTQEIGKSDGANTTPTDFTLYERYSTGTVTRLAALQSAVRGFAASVAAKAKGADGELGTEDDVDHRIAVVGFASGNPSETLYHNSEVFVGANQYQYNTTASQHYSEAFQSMKTQEGQNNVTASINALDANGATYTNLGVEMANGILRANPVPAGEKRNRVVIVFTDGVPGRTGYSSTVANSAISEANTSRSLGANVYAVGIFEGADATNAGNSDGTDTQKANWFMQNLSDNQGTPRTPSYYLSASDSGTLSNIFQQIANNIESGGSNTTLTEGTVIKDIVAPQFTLPKGASASNITLKTYRYTGVDNTGVDTWAENENAMGATAEVDGDRVSVTGFNFSENWCGTVTENGETTYRGSKLEISFKVEVKKGFLGGNGVETNASAGVYENGYSETPVMTFEKPTVDIPIADVTVDPAAKNVYLLQDVSVDTLKSGATVKVGDVSLDLGAENYGLEAWQNKYVDITVVITDKDGKEIPATGLADLTADSTYSITVTVSPNKTGTVTGKSGNGTGAINVFKPVLTYKDSSVYYGDSAPTDFTANLVSTQWKHGDTQADIATMGDAPLLIKTYTPDSTKIKDGKINTKQDVPVNVSVKIGEVDVADYVTFQHQACTDRTETLPTDSEFLLHVKTCQLTIIKSGGAAGEPYVFTVLKDGTKYSEASITGNGSVIIYELPVGTYTIQEDTGWSWRYTPSVGNGVTLSSGNATGEITCTNSLNKEYWLNGFSTVVANIFGTPKN